MIKEAIGYGNTVEEAKEDAMLALGAGVEDDVQIDVIAMPKKKVLGVFGGSRAEVRVYIELPDPKPAKKSGKPNKKAESKKAEKAVEAKPAAEKKQAAAKSEAQPKEEINAVDASEIPADTKAGKAIAYLKTILSSLGCENVGIKAAVRENGALIILEGEGLGVVIGRRGETLDALQHLVSLAANNGGGYFKITINIGDYREKREQTLVSLAKRVSAQVVKNGRSRALEPMSPYERRIIHTTVQEIKGVNSSSIGEGANRRVVISPEGVEATAHRVDRARRRGGRDRRPSNTVATAPTREPKRDSEAVPLYGKIESRAEEKE